MKKLLMCAIVAVSLVLCTGCSPIDVADATETDIGNVFSVVESGKMFGFGDYKVFSR